MLSNDFLISSNLKVCRRYQVRYRMSYDFELLGHQGLMMKDKNSTLSGINFFLNDRGRYILGVQWYSESRQIGFKHFHLTGNHDPCRPCHLRASPVCNKMQQEAEC